MSPLETVRRAAGPYLAARKRFEEKQRVLFVAIRQASKEGESVRAIADAAGLSFQRIQQIVARNGRTPADG